MVTGMLFTMNIGLSGSSLWLVSPLASDLGKGGRGACF